MATLKISDLSVGDWVKASGVAKRVHSIEYQNGVYFVNFSDPDTNSEDYMHAPSIKPIPITPEILEANGFEEHCGGIFRYEWMWQGESSGITLCSFDEELWFVDLFFKEGKDIMCNIPTFSVHQLQHILRLAGVDREIVMPNK